MPVLATAGADVESLGVFLHAGAAVEGHVQHQARKITGQHQIRATADDQPRQALDAWIVKNGAQAVHVVHRRKPGGAGRQAQGVEAAEGNVLAEQVGGGGGVVHWRTSARDAGAGRPNVRRQGLMSSPPRRV